MAAHARRKIYRLAEQFEVPKVADDASHLGGMGGGGDGGGLGGVGGGGESGGLQAMQLTW